jgi:hypothetical protein
VHVAAGQPRRRGADLAARAGFAVVAKPPIDRIRLYARERGWVNLAAGLLGGH